MTKREMMRMLERFEDNEEIMVVGLDEITIEIDRFASKTKVKAVQKAEEMMNHYRKMMEREANKYYHKEENRQKKITALYETYLKWESKVYENNY